MTMQLGPPNPPAKKFRILKIQDGGGRHFQKWKNRYITTI